MAITVLDRKSRSAAQRCIFDDIVFMGDVHCVLHNKPLCHTQSSSWSHAVFQYIFWVLLKYCSEALEVLI